VVDLASNTASLDDVIQRTTPAAPAPKADPLFDDLVKQAGALREDTKATSATLAEGSRAKLSIADQITKLRPPEPPKLEAPTKPPGEAPETNPLQAFGSPASWLAVFGGLLTRRPLQTSLDASAAAMNAYRQRDLESYDQHLKTWKTQSDYAQKTQEYQQALYRDAMASHKGNIDQLLSSLNMIASANQDTIAQHTLKTGDFALFEKLYKDREHQVEKFSEHKLALEKFAEEKEDHLRKDARQREHNKAMEGLGGRRADQLDRKLDLTDEQIQGTADYRAAVVKHMERGDERGEAAAKALKEQRDIQNAHAERRLDPSRKIDQGIITELRAYPEATPQSLGYIPPTSQNRIVMAFQSARQIERIAQYSVAHPEAVGLAAEALKRVNFDGIQSLQGSEGWFTEVAKRTEQAMDAVAQERKLTEPQAQTAKVLNKLVTTQAFADAAQSGTRGATVYLDRAFREIYQQASTLPTFLDIIMKRMEETNLNLDRYDLGLQRRSDKHEFSFFHTGVEGYANIAAQVEAARKEGQQVTLIQGPDRAKYDALPPGSAYVAIGEDGRAAFYKKGQQ
jgi:hypothetical protein